MENKEFIDQFKNVLKVNNNYNFILKDLNKNVFPFHIRNKYISYRRHYYWIKHHNVFKFKNLNKELKELVEKSMRPQT